MSATLTPGPDASIRTPMREFWRRLRGELRVVADCGHLLIGERPDPCADAIEAFVH